MPFDTRSWEWKLEQWAIAQATAAGTFQGIQLRHHDEADPANSQRIFFQAFTGSESPAGSGVYDTQLNVEFRSTDRDAVVTDPIFAALVSAFVNPVMTIPENAYFPAGLWFDQEASENARTDGTDTRDRSRNYAFSVGQVP